MNRDKPDEMLRIVNLEVSPLKIEGEDDLLIIVFTAEQPKETIDHNIKNGNSNSIAKNRRIKKLEEEITAARFDMASITQDQEAANEVLQSANEEIVSSNEELQSLNEELETSKEEIESTNEELITTNHELQTRIQQVEELYAYNEAILDTIQEPMLILDKNIRIKSANKAFCKTFHIIEEENIGISLYKLRNNQWNIPQLRDLIEEIIPKNNRFSNFELEHTFPIIGTKIMLLNAHRIIQKSNNEELIVLSIIDVTDVRKLALELQEKEMKVLELQLEAEKKAKKIFEDSEKRYNMMLMQSPYAFAILKGKDNVIILANDRVKELWGKGNNIEGKPLLKVLPELKNTAYPAQLNEVFVTGNPHQETEAAAPIFRNGRIEEVYFNFVYQPYREADETISGITIIAIEVTNEVIAKKKIIESKQELRKIKDQLDLSVTAGKIGLWHWDVKNDVLYWSNEQKEMYGVSTSEIITSSTQFNTLINPDDLKRIQKDQSAGNKIEHEYDFRINRKNDGVLRWIKSRARNLINQYGKLEFISGVNIDITEEKLLEEKLIEAKESAEKAAKSKQQFLSNMCHEIRKPMNAIIGFTNVLLKTNVDESQNEYLNAIKISGDALIVLINDILDLAKVNSGKMTFEEIQFDLHYSITTILQLFNQKVKENNVELIKEYDNNIPAILIGDPLRLRQILLNLLSNAVKFTKEGTITICVKIVNEDAEKITIEFSLCDTGIGIPANKLKNIFNSFEQASQETSRSYGGSGLGLAIAKQLVELQGGNITVTSKIGKGSTFVFTLDFIKVSTTEILQAQQDKKMLEDEVSINPLPKTIKVLVAEDVALNQLLIKIILMDFGFDFEIATNGKIAIELLQKNNYDIVLMDLQMPEMDGFETTDYIRNKMESNIPIIALTADVTTIDLEKCTAIGMNDYISKPIDEKLLYSKIMKYV